MQVSSTTLVKMGTQNIHMLKMTKILAIWSKNYPEKLLTYKQLWGCHRTMLRWLTLSPVIRPTCVQRNGKITTEITDKTTNNYCQKWRNAQQFKNYQSDIKARLYHTHSVISTTTCRLECVHVHCSYSTGLLTVCMCVVLIHPLVVRIQ